MQDQRAIQDFLRDTKDHELHILRDDGLYRHIRMKKPGTSAYHFDLITWPGHLCYTGDMGTFTFTRLADMFEFFRGRPGREFADIDLGYWAEKATSFDKCGPGVGRLEEFDADAFKRSVMQTLVGWIREARQDGTLSKSGRRDLWEAAIEQVVSRADYNDEHMAIGVMLEFSFDTRIDSYRCRGWQFDLEDLGSIRRYTHTFVWACCAIAHAIKKYDEAKDAAVPATESV